MLFMAHMKLCTKTLYSVLGLGYSHMVTKVNTSTEVGLIVRRQTAVSEREKIRMRKTEGSEGGRKQTPGNAWGVSSNSGLLAILAVSQNGGGQTRLVQVLHVEQ